MKRFAVCAILALVPSVFAFGEEAPAKAPEVEASAVQTPGQEKVTRFTIEAGLLEEIATLLNNPKKYQEANTMYLANLIARIQQDVKPVKDAAPAPKKSDKKK